ncbi:hypothetical protein [Actinoplanes regularis]|uniref:Uncharacterized protein n=1 Tax=Actinoplanes regularis TaxID=52697 RepID=A0A239EIJ7_9ACTN|nr:hypothetical protein [Actinoplanes regularis]GIE89111.1 hypothetical protein Are01nite_55910 [Actinoplanes regularis]SNS44476.1 hypothetical protein SAMN06264365_115203 [Actinoplanes regularis]
MTDEPLYAKLGFTDGEWGLLVGLPHAVLTAASAATQDSARKTRAESAAGLNRISDARASASTLVTAVATAAVAEAGDPELGEEPPVIEPANPAAYLRDVLDRAAETAGLLSAKASVADAETYRHWLLEITDAVVGAASTGGILGLGGETVTEDERSFRDHLASALAG